MTALLRPILPALALAVLTATAPTATALATPAGDVLGTEDALGRLAPEYRRAPLECALPRAALTLNDAIALTLCRNPSLQAAWAAARAQAATLGVAEAAYLPQLSLSGNDNRPGGDVLASGVGSDGRSALASLSWTLLDFGQRRHDVGGARDLLAAAAHGGSASAQKAVAETVRDYYSTVAAADTLAAQQQNEHNAARSLEIARALQTGGAATLADVMQAETFLHQAEYARIQAEAALQDANAALAVVMGFPADQGLQLARGAGPDAPAVTATVTELLAAAARQRPDLAAAREQWQAAGEAVGSARASGRPRLTLGALESLSTLNGLPQQNGHAIGLTLTVPVFSGFATHYGIRRAEALEAESAAQLESARLGVGYDVWSAYHALRAANDSLATSATLARAAATNEEIAIGRYQSGVGSILDVLTAQNAGANARLIRIQAEYAWTTSRAALALAVGQLRSAADLDAVAPTAGR